MSVNFVKENIPVSLNFKLNFKENIHNFFRKTSVIKLFTHLPSPLFRKHKEIAKLIMKCHATFGLGQNSVNPMQTRVYGGDKLETLHRLTDNRQKYAIPLKYETKLTFSTNNSLEAAREIKSNLVDKSARVGILNLANRRQPGGVGLAPYGGSQEEYLIRCSNLAWGLDPRFKSEKVHEQLRQIRLEEGYPDQPFNHHIPYFGAVVSKNVTFIDQANPEHFDVISAAAPDMRKGSDESQALKKLGPLAKKAQYQIIENKIKAIFEAALAENITNLVLGGFGCGCFKNDSKEVAESFKKVLNLEPYKNRFHNITFAITEESKLNIFREAIQG